MSAVLLLDFKQRKESPQRNNFTVIPLHRVDVDIELGGTAIPKSLEPVMPAQAGIQSLLAKWIPAFAGTTPQSIILTLELPWTIGCISSWLPMNWVQKHLANRSYYVYATGERPSIPWSSNMQPRATELDPDLLSTPFRVQTNWHVVAGAPSCGKTTLIKQLANHGFQTVVEPARLYIENEMARGSGIHPIRSNPAALQRKIREIQLSVEGGLRESDLLFLDGALPSSLAWYRLYGLNPNEILQECFYHRYACVFILDPLPFQPDDERIDEIAADVAYLEEWHIRDYRALGYRPVRVPALPPEERLAFVLKRLSDKKDDK